MNQDRVAQQLSAEWRAAGVGEGDMLLVHSSISRTLRRVKSLYGSACVELVVASLLEAVGEEGTLLFPLFNFDFTKGVPFDIRTTPSQMGVLTETARQWPGAVRTGHPIYSFAIIGKEANSFRGVTNFSGYGADSPFAMLHRARGKIGVIDLPDQQSMTFYHYVEEAFAVPYRYHKIFTGQYVDENGNKENRTFGLFVRNLEQGVQTQVDPMGELLWRKGLYSGCRPRERCGLRVISAEAMFDAVAEVIAQGRAKDLLYRIE